MSIDLWLVVVAAIPATLALLLYGALAPWWRSWPGWAFFSTLLAVALLLDLTLVFTWSHFSPATEEGISRGVMGVVIAGCWLKFVAVLRQQILRHRDRKGQS